MPSAGLEDHKRGLETHPAEMSRFCFSISSSTRTTSWGTAPPTACAPTSASPCRNRFMRYTDPSSSCAAAKKNLSDGSHARHEIALGNWKVVRSEWSRVERSQSLTEWSADDVRTLHCGKAPTPHLMSDIDKVWSENVQYCIGSSFCSSSSSSLCCKMSNQLSYE